MIALRTTALLTLAALLAIGPVAPGSPESNSAEMVIRSAPQATTQLVLTPSLRKDKE